MKTEKKVFQYVDVFHNGDGIGNDIKGISNFLYKKNISNWIVARNSESKDPNIFSRVQQVESQSTDLHILHYGGQGFPIQDFLKLPGKKILKFHNITPTEYFYPFTSPNIFEEFEKNFKKAQMELVSLVDDMDAIWADSQYNALTLEQFVGKKLNNILILPILRKYEQHNSSEKKKKIIFVGRWAPHKKLEDILFFFYFFLKLRPDYQLYLIGKKNSIFTKYNQYIRNCIRELGIQDSVNVLENLPDSELQMELSSAQVLISMSEHEGFGIPLLEGTGQGLIVFAYSQEAVRETLRGSGILFYKKDFAYLAELLSIVLENANIQKEVIDFQNKTISFYNQFPFEDYFKQFLDL